MYMYVVPPTYMYSGYGVQVQIQIHMVHVHAVVYTQKTVLTHLRFVIQCVKLPQKWRLMQEANWRFNLLSPLKFSGLWQ